MQETAFDASAAAGYDLAEYNRIGKYWLIRETDIEYLKPVFYGDTIEVKTWVMDFIECVPTRLRIYPRRLNRSHCPGCHRLGFSGSPIRPAL